MSMVSDEQLAGELSGDVSSYERWLQSENIPVYRGYSVEDLSRVNLGPWARKGGKGCFINLIGGEQSTDSYVCEIAPGGSLKPQKHLFEEFVLILQGRGATTIWNEGGPKQTFEWQEGSLFAIPLNASYQHFNGQGDKPVRYLGSTNAPLTINLYHNIDFIFNNSYVFKDRFSGEEGYFSTRGKLYSVANQTVRSWESNLIPDVRDFKLFELKVRGGGGSSVIFEMANGTMAAHISEFPVGGYKKAHRHGPGANIIIAGGQGYSLMWPEGGQRVHVPWQEGSFFVPPGRWFHQHFNTGSEPARYVALKFSGSRKYSMGRTSMSTESLYNAGDQIEYEVEDPEIGALFEKEMAAKGFQVKMPYAVKKQS
ncbi:MAG: ethanolamine ammonia lyase-activating protein [Dehalococcoidia bacterium]|nr:ethanolamine ammonia lyase-activating protein [Dehalococcoidia bacterium]